MGQLQNRVALITGAGRGIGRATALAFAREGAQVAVSARSNDELNSLVEEIRTAGGTSEAFPCDLTEPGAPARLAAAVTSAFGPVEILVNNAGIGSSSSPRPVVDFDDDFWEQTIKLNLTAPYHLCRAVLPGMIERKWGRIITTASINSRVASFHGAAYSASKHGVLGLMRTIAAEVAGDGITVNCVCPGPVKTLMNDKRIAYDAERLGRDLEAHEKSLTPIGGRLAPEDISPMMVYFASDEARMVTGQAYNIDGGLVMS